MVDGIQPTTEGRIVHFFEIEDGHLRRMRSDETINLFAANGMSLVGEYYAGQFFGSMDWLCRGCVPSDIANFFSGKPPLSKVAAVKLAAAQALFLGLNRVIRRRSLDITRPRPALKQLAVRVAKAGEGLDAAVGSLAGLEWRLLKQRRSGLRKIRVREVERRRLSTSIAARSSSRHPPTRSDHTCPGATPAIHRAPPRAAVRRSLYTARGTPTARLRHESSRRKHRVIHTKHNRSVHRLTATAATSLCATRL